MLKIILSFIIGFIVGHNIEKIFRYISIKFLSLKFKESKYKNFFDNVENYDFWDKDDF